MIILNVTKNQGFTLSLKNTFLEKPQGESNLSPPSLFSVNFQKQIGEERKNAFQERIRLVFQPRVKYCSIKISLLCKDKSYRLERWV